MRRYAQRVNTLSTEDVDSFLMIIIATDLATLVLYLINHHKLSDAYVVLLFIKIVVSKVVGTCLGSSY